jgi:hypothetical protein
MRGHIIGVAALLLSACAHPAPALQTTREVEVTVPHIASFNEDEYRLNEAHEVCRAEANARQADWTACGGRRSREATRFVCSRHVAETRWSSPLFW